MVLPALLDGYLLRAWLAGPARDTAAPTLLAALGAEASLGAALRASGPALAKVAVREAARRFDSGAVALLIADVRDSLRRQLVSAARTLDGRGERALALSLGAVARRLNEDTFVQHLVNAVLEACELYTEAQPLEPRLGTLRRVEAAVTALLERSLCVLLPRSDAGRMIRDGAAPAFSWPPAPIARG